MRGGRGVLAALLLVTAGLQAVSVSRVDDAPRRAPVLSSGQSVTTAVEGLFDGAIVAPGEAGTPAATPPPQVVAPVPHRAAGGFAAGPLPTLPPAAGSAAPTARATGPASVAPRPSPAATHRATARPAPTRKPSPKPTTPAYSTDISRVGTQLYLYAKPYRFTGIDAYGLATDYGHNAGCDAPTSDAALDSFFSSLRPNSLVRIWAFQFLAVNPSTGARDWTGLDRVFAAAAAHHQRLIAVLANQSGVCDDEQWHGLAWYQSGFQGAYLSWVREVVARYARSPALGFWEPMNEAEDSDCAAGYSAGDCYGHLSCAGGTAEVLRDWFTTVGAELHRLDPRHLVSAGVLGLGECGVQNEYYGWIAASPGVDVMTVHDYTVAAPAWDGVLADRWARSMAAGKPLLLEEWGDNASTSVAGCLSLNSRAAELSAKLDAIVAHPGMAGITPWHWEAGGTDCSTEITPGDPALVVLRTHPL